MAIIRKKKRKRTRKLPGDQVGFRRPIMVDSQQKIKV